MACVTLCVPRQAAEAFSLSSTTINYFPKLQLPGVGLLIHFQPLSFSSLSSIPTKLFLLHKLSTYLPTYELIGLQLIELSNAFCL